MRLADAPYTYGYKDRKANKIKKKIQSNKKLSKKVCVIVKPFLGDGLFEIYSYMHLLNGSYKSLMDDITVVGVAANRGFANTLIVDLVQDIYDSDVDFDVNKYFGL